MFGYVEYVLRGETAVAVLEDGGTWTCKDRVIENILNGRFALDRFAGPAYGTPGNECLLRASEYLGGGQITLEPDDDENETESGKVSDY